MEANLSSAVDQDGSESSDREQDFSEPGQVEPDDAYVNELMRVGYFVKCHLLDLDLELGELLTADGHVGVFRRLARRDDGSSILPVALNQKFNTLVTTSVSCQLSPLAHSLGHWTGPLAAEGTGIVVEELPDKFAQTAVVMQTLLTSLEDLVTALEQMGGRLWTQALVVGTTDQQEQGRRVRDNRVPPEAQSGLLDYHGQAIYDTLDAARSRTTTLISVCNGVLGYAGPEARPIEY
jgi:hypothetical protein